MPGHFGRGRKVLWSSDQSITAGLRRSTARCTRRSRSICPAPSSKFCRRWSGFRPTAFLSKTIVQSSAPRAVRLSPCQPTSTWQGARENEVSPKSAGNWWCGVHQRWVNFVKVRPDRLRSTPLTFWIEKRRSSAVERRSRNSSLQREMHNGELVLGRCSPGCSEKIRAVDGPVGDVSETYHRITPAMKQPTCLLQASSVMSRQMEKSTSNRPPYGLLGCSAVTRINYGWQSLFTVHLFLVANATSIS